MITESVCHPVSDLSEETFVSTTTDAEECIEDQDVVLVSYRPIDHLRDGMKRLRFVAVGLMQRDVELDNDAIEGLATILEDVAYNMDRAYTWYIESNLVRK